MLPVEQQFKTYTGLDGKPLDNGYVYFGAPDQDPIMHPVTVYWDAAGTLPAAQPLRTVNGYIIRNGTPANLFRDGAYSELVKDSKDRQVFYARTSDDFSVATLITDFLGNTAAQNLADLAALRSLSGSSEVKYTTVTGYGQFYYDAEDTTSADNGLSIIVAGDGGRWKLRTGDVEEVVAGTEGVIFQNGYRAVASGSLEVPKFNDANVRYWTATYALKIPADAVIPPGDVRHDHVALNGRAMTSALYSRLWGGCFLAENNSAATNNAETGQCYGLEVDVNNKTGYDVNNLNGDGDIGGILVASGGSNISKFGYMLSKGGSAKGFFAGLYMREHSVDPSGFAAYFGNIEPAHGLYFAQDYFGGTALSAKLGLPVEFRTVAGPVAKILSFSDQLQFNCGNGGFAFANASNTSTLAQLSNGGNMVVGGDLVGTERFKVRAGASGGRAMMLLNGDGSIIAYTAIDTKGLAGGESTADAALYVRRDSINSRSINAAGTVNAGGADYAEYMPLAPGCGVVQKGQVVGITTTGQITDKWSEAISFCVKSTDPSYVGGDTWSAHLGSRPEAPVFVPPPYEGAQEPGAEPVPPAWKKVRDYSGQLRAQPPNEEEIATYQAAVAAHQEAVQAHVRDAQEHEERIATAQQLFTAGPYQFYLEQVREFDAALEAARKTVDRIAFAGQVPVNVLSAEPGQYIVPVQNGDGITGLAKNETDMTLAEYMRAIGKVIAIEADGRARIIVKVA